MRLLDAITRLYKKTVDNAFIELNKVQSRAVLYLSGTLLPIFSG